ncbi:MAG TPA: phosphoadenosine phosphosulfate reductase family protein, partial [Methylocella sp.]|nr:phosphoadenosine phosphosulfate reductase family protein [Methylocella sp.]
ITPLRRAEYLAHSASRRFRAREAEAMDLVRRLIDEHSYVSWSAGKDSMVVADLCRRANPSIPVLMADPGCPVHWTEDERSAMLSYAAAHGWDIHIFNWDKESIMAGSGSVEQKRSRIHGIMFSELTQWADEHSLDQRFLGIRAAESRSRRLHLYGRGPAGRNKDGRRWAAPIYNWSTADVWAYILSRGLPWLSIYDRAGPEARNGLIGHSGASHGRMGWLKIHYPDVYEEAKRLAPDAVNLSSL